MQDICIDYCESTFCDGCKYKDASDQEREDAYYEIIDKILRGDKDETF